MSVLNQNENDDHSHGDDACTNATSLSSTSSPPMQGEEEESTTEEYLRNIWSLLGVGENGFLEQNDLYRICEHIGMEGINDEIIEQLFVKLDHDLDGRISFNEFLEGLQQFGDTATCVSNFSPLDISQESPQMHVHSHSHSQSQSSQMHSHANTSQAQFNQQLQSKESQPTQSNNGNISNISNIENISNISTSTNQNANESVDLLMEHRRFYSNMNSYIIPLDYSDRNSINYEQVKDERDRLRMNIVEANARVDLLAQEVDEHLATIEQTSQQKINLLEKKYQERIRFLEEELRKEREKHELQSFHLNQNIIEELSIKQQEDVKLRERITMLEQENKRLEAEIQHLNEKNWEMQQIGLDLQKQVEDSQVMKKRFAEMEGMQGILKEQQYNSLLQEMHMLQMQNKELQDHNDELLLEIEKTQQQLVTKRLKKNDSSFFDENYLQTQVSKEEMPVCDENMDYQSLNDSIEVTRLNKELQLSDEKLIKLERENSRLHNKCRVLSKLLSEINNSSRE